MCNQERSTQQLLVCIYYFRLIKMKSNSENKCVMFNLPKDKFQLYVSLFQTRYKLPYN